LNYGGQVYIYIYGRYSNRTCISATVHVFIIIENQFIGLGFLEEKNAFLFPIALTKTTKYGSYFLSLLFIRARARACARTVIDYFDEIIKLISIRAIACISVYVLCAYFSVVERILKHAYGNNEITNDFFPYDRTNFIKRNGHL